MTSMIPIRLALVSEAQLAESSLFVGQSPERLSIGHLAALEGV